MRLWVATHAGQTELIGTYAINAYHLEGNDLPISLTRNAPRTGGVPAICLSMIAVDHRYQNQGLGRVLLADALERTATVADQVGTRVVVLDVIEDGGQEMTRGRLRIPYRHGLSISAISAFKNVHEY